jgi:hypothetical protein
VTLSYMSDSLFTTPTHRTYYYVDGLRWLINDDDDYITIMMYLPCSTICLLECSSSGLSPLFTYTLYG